MLENGWLLCVHANVSKFAVYYYIIAKTISFMKITKRTFKGVKKKPNKSVKLCAKCKKLSFR